jgi:hypothetical protein
MGPTSSWSRRGPPAQDDCEGCEGQEALMSRRRATQLGVGLQREARWLKVARRLDFHVAPAESAPSS